MKPPLLIPLLFLFLLVSKQTEAQLQFENTYGLLLNDPSGITVLRGTVALNNLIPVARNKSNNSRAYNDPGSISKDLVATNKKNNFNIGVYYTTEMCCGFSSKNSKSERQGSLRDLLGLSLRFFDKFSIYGGLGFFRSGLLNEPDFELVRKEVGVAFQIPKYNMTLSSSYGEKKGLSLNVGYFVPFNKSKP